MPYHNDYAPASAVLIIKKLTMSRQVQQKSGGPAGIEVGLSAVGISFGKPRSVRRPETRMRPAAA
jgi:hypothetical protein